MELLLYHGKFLWNVRQTESDLMSFDVFRLQRGNIARGTACGLHYLHSNVPPIIHGDIKSANILLDRHFEPKIGDFGLCRGGDPEKSHLTVNQIHGGTKYYMPDDFLRDRHLCPGVDAFCFGITLFELICGNYISFFIFV